MTSSGPEPLAWLRAELFAVAAAAVPGRDGVVTSETPAVGDPGDGGRRGPAGCVVEAGDPEVADGIGVQVDRIAEAFRVRGWSVRLDADGSQHRVVASTGSSADAATATAATATVIGWDGHWKLTLLGEAR